MEEYSFQGLSPLDFELFVRDLLNAELGATLSSFAPGPDGGVDLRGRVGDQILVAQCKHTPNASKAQLVRTATAENTRALPLVDVYLFATSASMSPATEYAVEKALADLPLATDGIWHRGRLNAALARQPRVQRLHFKIWLTAGHTLEHLLNAKVWQRSEALLASVIDRGRLYVTTPAFERAWDLLQETNVVVITGPPGVGKSTLAEMLLVQYSREGWIIANITDDLSDSWPAILTSDEKVLLYCDDFLGQTDIAQVTGGTANSLSLLMDRVRNGDGRVRMIMTSRDQVLAQAAAGHDDRLRRLPVDEHRARVNLAEFSRSEKAEIVFTHLHFSNDDPTLRRDLASDPRALQLIDHPNFNPRLIESTALRQRFRSAEEFYSRALAAMTDPGEVWAASYEQLSPLASRILLYLAATPAGRATHDEMRAVLATNIDPRAWISALKVLEGSWVRIFMASNATQVSLFDASRKDFLFGLLADPGYFVATLDTLSNMRQLSYVLTVSGVGRPDLGESKLGGTVLRYWEVVRQRFGAILDNEAAVLEAGNARRRQSRRSKGIAPSSDAQGGTLQLGTDAQARAEFIESCTAVFRLLDRPEEYSERYWTLMRRQLDTLRMPQLASDVRGHAASFFALAGLVYDAHRSDLYPFALDCIKVGIYAAVSLEDLDDNLDTLVVPPEHVTKIAPLFEGSSADWWDDDEALEEEVQEAYSWAVEPVEDGIAEFEDALEYLLNLELDEIRVSQTREQARRRLRELENRSRHYGVSVSGFKVWETKDEIWHLPQSTPPENPTLHRIVPAGRYSTDVAIRALLGRLASEGE